MIRIFTAFQQHPIHPRLEMQRDWLTAHGKPVQVFFDAPKKPGFAANLLNLLSLKYFRSDLVRSYKRELEGCEIVHIYDLRLLPLAKAAKRAGKKVVYETLDDNVHLHFHALEKITKAFRLIRWFCVPYMEKREQRLIRRYCDQVIVNSPNLLKLSPEKATLIYYASPFEDVQTAAFDPAKKSVFLYLGKLTVSKGAQAYAQLSEDFQTDVHFFGQAKDAFSQNWAASPHVIAYGNKPSTELKAALRSLSEECNLIGLSIIIPENESYALQEANKDIDYMCLGIPFIGNERIPTYDKIRSGAGVLYSDAEQIARLLRNENGAYDAIRQTQHALYAEKFSKQTFFERLAKVYESL